MTTFEECMQEQFKKLVPYKPLTAPELAAMILGAAAWLEQKKQDWYSGKFSDNIEDLFDDLNRELLNGGN